MTDDQGGDWGSPQADAPQPNPEQAPAQPAGNTPRPGSPEADALARTVTPQGEQNPERQLPSQGENEPRKGVRMPIVIAVVIGVAVTYFLVQGRVPMGGSSDGFNETCTTLELGLPAFEAREKLTAAAAREGMAGPADIRVEGSRMAFGYRPQGAPPNMVRGCMVQLSQDGRSVVGGAVVR